MAPRTSLPHPSADRRTAGLSRRGALGLALAALAVPLVACGADDAGRGGDASAAGADAAFAPVTIEHAFGSTTLEQRPARVATWGWGSSDAAIALGVVPVAMPRNSYGAEDDGLMPWQRQALDAAGAEVPTLLSEGDAPPFEEIAAAAPDVILANYSGITEADYAKLAKIAPTIAYPEKPWSTPWRDVVTTVGTALGRASQAQTLLREIDAQVAAAAQAHPEFAGRTIAAVAIDPAAFYVYTPADPRVQFLEDLGFEVAPSVSRLAGDEQGFYYTLSPERLDELTSDVLLSYVPDEARRTAIADDATYRALPQMGAGTVASVVGESYVSAVSPPTALSLTWGLDAFVEALVPAVRAVEA